MQSMVDVVVAKYMRPEQATEFMEYLLRLALYDLEEVWADELTACRHAFSVAQLGVEEHILRADAMEAENIRLKAQMKEQEAAVKQAKTRDDLLRLYNTEAP